MTTVAEPRDGEVVGARRLARDDDAPVRLQRDRVAEGGGAEVDQALARTGPEAGVERAVESSRATAKSSSACV